jgi:type IV pilus assembly protein PilM
MAKVKAVWGIDVGRCALKAIKLAEGDNGIEVVARDYIGHGKILSQSDADPPELIAKSLEKFLSRNDISEDGVVVSVPGQHTLARFSKLPPVDPKKVPDIVQFEANQQIPFDMDEVIWDYQAFSEEDSPEIEVGIFAMKRDLIHQHLAHFSDVGIEPLLVQSAPLAVFDAMRFDEQLGDDTTAMIDIGAENTDLIITDGIRIWTRTIPIGGNNFTDALAGGFKLSFSKAENLKRQAANSKYARQIFQAMRPVFADLVAEIQRSIGFYTSTHREAKLEKLIGVGDAFKLPGLQKFLQQNLGIKVSKPSGFKKVGGADALGDKKEHVLSFAVAYGLAVEGLGEGYMRNNLLPIEIARQAVWRKKRPWFAAAAACLLLSSMLVYWRQSADLSRIRVNEIGKPTLMTFDRAASAYKNGVNVDDDRDFALEVAGVADSISTEYTRAAGDGKDQEEQCEDIITLFLERHLVARIIDVVHNSLPSPGGPLESAADAKAYVAVLTSAGDTLPREAREQVFVKSLKSEFTTNVYADDYRRPEQREGDDELFDFFTDDDVPGFVVTLQCRTSHQGRGAFIERQGGFVQSLKANGRNEDLGFYFDGVRLLGGLSAMSAPTTARPSRALGGAMPTQSAASKGDRDLLTFEDASGDWEFEVKFVVAQFELPDEPTPGTPETKKKPRGGRG